MADKQFARSGPAEFDVLADDDPLSELARIVGYDARPAVQQLQELQRHQEAIRRDPTFDLEEELLRAFDSYDAPRAAPVQPDSGLVDHPVAAAVAEHRDAGEEPSAEAEILVDDIVPAVEHHAAPTLAPVEQQADDLLPSSSLADPGFSGDDEDVARAQEADPAVDLERELELSLGYEDPSAETTASQDTVRQTSHQPEVDELPAFDDWQEPLASKLAAAAKVDEPADASGALYVDMVDDFAARRDGEALRAEAVADTPMVAPIGVSDQVDHLLADVERFPVPSATDLVAAAVASHPAVHVRPAAPVKKSSYPFTPTFSRATPVASPAGVSQQRAFAKPMAESAAASLISPVVLPEAAPSAIPGALPSGAMQGGLPEAEVEPSFDLDDFELELSDLALDVDLADNGAPKADESAAEQPVVTHPALVEPSAQPFLQALTTPSEPEPNRHEPLASALPEIEEAPAENPLPFDPAMIGETESGVAPIADMDVPQLPALDTEEKPVSYPADYDLDIDAEMAQLFGTPAPAAKSASHAGDFDLDVGARAASAAKASPAVASLDDFDEFERAMEEDFQRSMAERQSPTHDAERLAARPRLDEAAEYGEPAYGGRSQRTMLMAASVAGVIILGGAAVYAWMGGSSAVLSGDGPKIILADKEPVKVVPEVKGGKTVPNQDKAVYDRVAGDQGSAPRQEALVSSTEEPMDVVQRTLTPETLPLEGSDEGEALAGVSTGDEDEVARLLPDENNGNAAEEERAPAVAPRKVRTMIVKPDGTLVAREEPAAKPADDIAANGNDQPIPATASGEAVASVSQGNTAVAEVGSELRAAEQPNASDEVALAAAGKGPANEAPVRSVKTTAVGGGQAPLPETRPAAQTGTAAKPETAASPAESRAPAETASAAQTAPLATASVPAGTYVIQIASLPSEAEAQKSYNNLSGKFASVIGGRGVDIRKAEIAGKGTYYRVRIPAGTREEANSLCSRYKSAGGSCLVTK
ncbi:SPOR domain-containing protein [Sinorhizobium numidicum]|uniref:SPOR domain-containing protein n=1 Tax=Sinorhizobium numidicum TaxID=680248 RepID=A0ABY8CZ78_9HYPH|nr:SPOR domain-containing protein [Sinorhizobium numidicum]WEX78844.1 SPOR domain-containing protein [Sinorhizobium numidicum]WEX82241.1 SPOR domain-containing protein [Sinorhizobium numidicum]